MPAPSDEDVETSSDAWAFPARQWRWAALALAVLFASLPLAAKLLLRSWEFDGAHGIACLLLAVAGSLLRRAREAGADPRSRCHPDAAIRVVALGQTDRGLALLDEALRLSPRLWQARQYRGEMRLAASDAAESALQDFTEAIRLAPTNRTSISFAATSSPCSGAIRPRAPIWRPPSGWAETASERR